MTIYLICKYMTRYVYIIYTIYIYHMIHYYTWFIEKPQSAKKISKSFNIKMFKSKINNDK